MEIWKDYVSLGAVAWGCGQKAAAQKWFSEAQREALRCDRSDSCRLEMLSNIGDFFARRQSYSQAEMVYRRAVRLAKRFRASEAETLSLVEKLTRLYLLRKKHKLAHSLLSRSAAIAIDGEENPVLKKLIAHLALGYTQCGKIEAATKLYLEGFSSRASR